jgi:2-oxoglutarate ferredoxin oxidoreductase subunit alpha
VPAPEFYQEQNSHSIGIIFYGTTAYPALETMDLLREDGVLVDAMRILAFPFNDQVNEFIDAHDVVYVIEQNRDAQMRTLLMVECDADPKKLRKVLNYDGMPITAAAIAAAIKADHEVEVAK